MPSRVWSLLIDLVERKLSPRTTPVIVWRREPFGCFHGILGMTVSVVDRVWSYSMMNDESVVRYLDAELQRHQCSWQ